MLLYSILTANGRTFLENSSCNESAEERIAVLLLNVSLFFICAHINKAAKNPPKSIVFSEHFKALQTRR